MIFKTPSVRFTVIVTPVYAHRVSSFRTVGRLSQPSGHDDGKPGDDVGSSKLLMMGRINGAGKGRAEIILLTSRTSPRRKEQRESLLWKHYLSEPSRLAFLCMSWSGRMEHPQT